jgi:hypothetical protein
LENTIVPTAQAWKFREPPEIPVQTTRQVLLGGRPITHVIHEIDGMRWWFLHEETYAMEDLVSTTLREIVQIDPTIHSVATLHRGWMASRRDIDGEWTQQRDGPPLESAWAEVMTVLA